jgi:hypothetical protein
MNASSSSATNMVCSTDANDSADLSVFGDQQELETAIGAPLEGGRGRAAGE